MLDALLTFLLPGFLNKKGRVLEDQQAKLMIGSLHPLQKLILAW